MLLIIILTIMLLWFFSIAKLWKYLEGCIYRCCFLQMILIEATLTLSFPNFPTIYSFYNNILNPNFSIIYRFSYYTRTQYDNILTYLLDLIICWSLMVKFLACFFFTVKLWSVLKYWVYMYFFLQLTLIKIII